MKILHLLFTGEVGGIEKLCSGIAEFDKNNSDFCFLYEGGVICEKIKKTGANVTEFHINKYNYIYAAFMLIKLCITKKYKQIIVHHTGPSLWIPAIILKYVRPNTKLFVYAHSDYKAFVGNNIFRKLVFDAIAKKADNVIAISDYVKSTVVSGNKHCLKKTVTVYNGIDVVLYITHRSTDFTEPLRIIYVGRLVKQKGIEMLIDSLSLLDIPYTLDIVGHGVMYEVLQKKIDQLDLNNRIHLRGKQRNIAEWLSKADIFVHPAILAEGFGLTIAEAMASGLICVAFNRGAIPELIQNGKSGFCVDECNKESLAKALVNVYSQLKQDNMIKMREAAQERAKHFTINETVKKLHEIIEGE